jgi:hypothetical protein
VNPDLAFEVIGEFVVIFAALCILDWLLWQLAKWLLR